MNAKEKSQITDLITAIDKHNLKLHNKIEKILSTLEDDPNSSSVGLISKVNALESDVKRLVMFSRNAKRVAGIVATGITFIIGILIKRYNL